jgi:hypothetical protein
MHDAPEFESVLSLCFALSLSARRVIYSRGGVFTPDVFLAAYDAVYRGARASAAQCALAYSHSTVRPHSHADASHTLTGYTYTLTQATQVHTFITHTYCIRAPTALVRSHTLRLQSVVSCWPMLGGMR